MNDHEQKLPDLDPTTVPGYHPGKERSEAGTDDDVSTRKREEREGPSLPGQAASGGGGPVSGVSAGERLPAARDAGLEKRKA